MQQAILILFQLFQQFLLPSLLSRGMSQHSYSRCWLHLIWATLDRPRTETVETVKEYSSLDFCHPDEPKACGAHRGVNEMRDESVMISRTSHADDPLSVSSIAINVRISKRLFVHCICPSR